MLPYVLIFTLVGLGLVFGGRHMARETLRAARWPVVIGVLEHCDVILTSSGDANDAALWTLDLRYAYVVDGRAYRGSRYAFGFEDGPDDGPFREAAERLLRMPHLPVHVDPADPANAVISTQVPGNVIALGYGSLVMAAVALLVVIASA